MSALDLTPGQVSPLTVEIYDSSGTLGHVDTFMPYFPDTIQAPPRPPR